MDILKERLKEKKNQKELNNLIILNRYYILNITKLKKLIESKELKENKEDLSIVLNNLEQILKKKEEELLKIKILIDDKKINISIESFNRFNEKLKSDLDWVKSLKCELL